MAHMRHWAAGSTTAGTRVGALLSVVGGPPEREVFLWEGRRQLFGQPCVDAMHLMGLLVSPGQVVQLVHDDLAIAHRLNVLSAWQLRLSPNAR